MTIANAYAAAIKGNGFAVYAGAEPDEHFRARLFAYYRQRGYPAAKALLMARNTVAGTVGHWPRRGRNINQPVKGGGRWIESPGDAGLRFVGWCDEIAGLNHRGWFTVDSDLGRVCRGAVYQLPARGGRPLFVEAYHNGEDGPNGWTDDTGGAFVFLDERHTGEDSEGDDAKRDAARGADHEAERAAADEREYHEAWNAGRVTREAVERARQLRADARPILAELRALKAAGIAAPAACAALRETVAGMLAKARRKVRTARQEWEAGSDSAAFLDGADAATFAELAR